MWFQHSYPWCELNEDCICFNLTLSLFVQVHTESVWFWIPVSPVSEDQVYRRNAIRSIWILPKQTCNAWLPSWDDIPIVAKNLSVVLLDIISKPRAVVHLLKKCSTTRMKLNPGGDVGVESANRPWVFCCLLAQSQTKWMFEPSRRYFYYPFLQVLCIQGLCPNFS